MILATAKLLYRRLKTISYQVQDNIIYIISKRLLPPIVELEGVRINTIGHHISPIIERSIRSGTYEYAEIQILKSYLSQNDIVMEIGAGIGFLSTYCARQIGSERVFAYEANPNLEVAIHHTYEINGVNPTLEICLVREETGLRNFYITKDFWSSSFIKPNSNDVDRTVKVTSKSFNKEVERIKPSFLIIDIEGGEYELLKDANLDSIQKIAIELHNSIIGEEEIEEVKNKLQNAGFEVIKQFPNCEDEILFLQRLH